MQAKTKTMYVVWNLVGNECVAFDNQAEAHWTAHGEWPRGHRSNAVPAVGAAFRDLYEDDLPEGGAFQIRQEALTQPVIAGSQAESSADDGQAMHRFRFKLASEDYRPIAFPPVGPFWCTGSNDTHQIVVAYAPDEETLTNADHWPDAEDVQDLGREEISFTDRFPKPGWWVATSERT